MIHSSIDGQTEKICGHLEKICETKHKVELVSINNVDEIELSIYDKIVIGASVRYGKHRNTVYQFVKDRLDVLNKKQTYFFSVNVVARKKEKNTPDTNPYLLKFLEKTSWKPTKTEVFAGKVDYPNYGFFDKNIIRFIMFLTKGPTDTTKSYEFTDWNKVEKFAKLVANHT
tara:strand:+ start:123 stop:635 length:513 start_codon:yes stop_codon:yes gene_type:complete